MSIGGFAGAAVQTASSTRSFPAKHRNAGYGRTGREAARISRKAGRSVVRGLPAKIHRPAGRGYGKGAGAGEKYQQNAALLKRFQPGTSCPVCRRVLPQQEYPAFRQALQAETEKIAADGTQLKGQIAELQEMEQKAKARSSSSNMDWENKRSDSSLRIKITSFLFINAP